MGPSPEFCAFCHSPMAFEGKLKPMVVRRALIYRTSNRI